MKTPRQPLYLVRESYRRRRLMDAARVLPVLGIFLLILPEFWGAPDLPGHDTARRGLYLFGVWFGLIGAALFLALRLRPDDGASDPQPLNPQPTNPQPADPQPADPQPADPQPADPQPTHPPPTDEREKREER